MSLTSGSAVTRLGDLMAEQWRSRLGKWERPDRVVVYDEVGPVQRRPAVLSRTTNS
jgi:hypothetical protein